MNKRTTSPRVEHIELSFGEALSAASVIDRRHPLALKSRLVNGRIHGDSIEDPIVGELVYRLVGYFLEAQPPKEIRYRYPLTWWDHFKEACFPAWALKRWPPVYKSEATVIKDIYPFPKVYLGGCLGPVYRIARMSSFTGYPGAGDEP